MTQIAPLPPPPFPAGSAPPPADPTTRDVQRQSLEQLVQLSIECTAEETRVEEEYASALARENGDYQKKTQSAKQRFKQRMADLTSTSNQKQESIQSRYESQKTTAEGDFQKLQRQIAFSRDQGDSALKKQVEQVSWQAESVFVAFEMKIDVEEQKFKKDFEASKIELASLASLEAAAKQCLTRYRVEPYAVEAPIDDALRQKIEADAKAVHGEYRTRAMTGLAALQELTKARVMDDILPLISIFTLALIAAAIGWVVGTGDQQKQLIYAGSAAGGAIVLGVILWLILRSRKRARIRAKAKTIYEPFMQELAVAIRAATLDPEAAALARQRRVDEARDKRDQESLAAKEKGKALLLKSAEQYKATLTQEAERYKSRTAALEQERDTALSDLQQSREKTAAQIEQEGNQALQEARTQHDQILQAIEAKHDKEWSALQTRWDDGLRAVNELLAAGMGIDPQLIDWKNPAWQNWKSPAEFSGLVRFGEMKVDLAQLTQQVPKRLQLPGQFNVPALLSMPAHASLFLEADHVGRSACNDMAQMVMARLLTQMPAGRAKFTIIDPVGLGQSFAGFMHLADHDESLIASRIWTEKEHIHQRLADLTEHMETVIQKYLRNEYATIDQYNAQAGELAEPFRFLVIADFPTGFESESLRRLSSIVLTGPRCGVYTIILRDTRQVIPPGSRIEEIISRSVHLTHKNGVFTWDDAVFNRFPLAVDPPPDEKTLTGLLDLVGKAAKEAKRVEVPFASIAPKDGQFWCLSTKDDLRVPIGKSGATRLQPLRLGVGVAQHALVAGKTGSGKSNLMHTIVTNLAMWYSPDEIEFYLIDFKKGVEFKAYVTSQLPHARAIAVESDREFGISVLQRVDAELTRRGILFRDTGVQEISAYRDKTGQMLPRTLLLIDEFQEFFSEDDKLGQEAAGLLDRLVRQGRAFGVHLVLGSQTIGGGSGLGRATLGQIAVRVALQCSEADSQMILGDNNSAARLLSRPGEAVYNDAGGLVEANSPFQIAFLPDEQREVYLEKVRALSQAKTAAGAPVREPIVFEGNNAAPIRKNARLMALLQQTAFPPPASSINAYIGEPVAIKEPTSMRLRSQSGVNVLMVGQQEESAVAIFASIMTSIAAQNAPKDAVFYLMDGSPSDSRYFGLLERVAASIPHQTKVVGWRDVPASINEIASTFAQRQAAASEAAAPTASSSPQDAAGGPAIYLLIFGLQRYRLLRRQEDDFSFKKDEESGPKVDKQFAELLAEGPPHGIHTLIWADTPITVERTLDRGAMRQFDYRILFQMSASDSSNLIDNTAANRLGGHRALLYSEEQGTFEKFRPYQAPDEAWLQFLASQLKNRPSS